MDQTSQNEKEDRKKLFQLIVNLLHSAGYFRVNIHGLSEFDKVVGGLCWCIISSGEAVDVDILFTENSTIGERIALSEAIVVALRQMQCPHSLQPHQIQGGIGGADFKAIHPVLQWLIKKFSQRRDEIEWQLRTFSTLQCVDKCSLRRTLKTGVANELKQIADRKKAIRHFKGENSDGLAEELRVRAVLLEYGDAYGVGVDGSIRVAVGVGGTSNLDQLAKTNASELNAFERKLAQAQRDAERDEKAFLEKASKDEEELMRHMMGASDGSTVSGSAAGALVGMGSDEIGNAAAAYEAELDDAKKLLEANLKGRMGEKAQHRKQLDQLNARLQELQKLSLERNPGSTEAKSNAENALSKLAAIEALLTSLRAEKAKLEEDERSSTQQGDLKTIKDLIMFNEKCKSQETGFKAACKAERAAILEEITQLEARDAGEEEKKFQGIEDMYEKVIAKYKRLKQVLAETNLAVASNLRKIDDIPTRSELIQYERRFEELYLEAAMKLGDTKKFYTLYNSLDTQLSFLQKEVKLLNSISDNFDQAMQSAPSKLEYLSQCSNIVGGVNDSVSQQTDKLHMRSDILSALKTRHQMLVEEQRQYYKAIKDFQDECTKNEWLESKIASL